jgi:nitrile hydratase accessory protein
MTSDAVEQAIAYADGPAALPRENGELVFAAPWESRAFAIAIALSGEVYDWEDFRAELIAEIARWEEEAGAAEDEWSYYERWLTSLETVLVARGVISPGELSKRIDAVAHAEAHEHDHDHPHHHD